MKAENKDIQKRKYEIAFVLKTEDSSVISQSLISKGFAILAENPLEKIQLAYPIKKESYAYFSYSHFEGDPAAVKSLKEELKLNPLVLRYMIITPPFIKKSAGRRPALVKSPEEETKPAATPSEPLLTNEALEKKIEEILK